MERLNTNCTCFTPQENCFTGMCTYCNRIIQRNISTEDLLPKNRWKHVGKELTETEIHENRSSKYEFLEFSKEETIEEAAEKFYPPYPDGFVTSEIYALREGFVKGFNAKQERSYSEEDVLKFTQTIISQYKSGNTNIENIDLLTETPDKFKNSRKLSRKNNRPLKR